jgi:hypothetical protein
MRLQSSLRRLRLGFTAELRNPGLRLLGLAGFLAAAAYAWGQGDLAGPTAIVLTSWGGKLFGWAACLWFAYAAVRDQNEKLGAALRSKPMDGAWWVLMLWATGLCTWLALLFCPFLGAGLAQLPRAGLASIESHGIAFLRAALILTSTGTLSFALSRMLRSPLGGVLVVFAWFCSMAGMQYLSLYLRLDYAQNQRLFLATAALLLSVAAYLVERHRRGELRRPGPALLAAAVLLLLTGAGALRAYRRAPDLLLDERPLWQQISRQHVMRDQRTPGFWLADGRGGWVRTSDHAGKILLIFLFAPDDLESARTLSALQAIARDYGSRGVQPIGVCLSPDHGDGWALSRYGGYRFPIGSDLGTVKSSPAQSPVAIAYDLQLLPALVVTDRRRTVRSFLKEPFYDVVTLRRLVEERLAAEPE